MASVELDPVFVRAIRLLHSKSKDSTEQLKSMLDDSLALRYSSSFKDTKPLYSSSVIKQETSDSRIKKASPKNELSTKATFEDVRKKETEKRTAEKHKLEPLSAVETKRTKLESPSSNSSSPQSIKMEDSSETSEEGNADDFAMEMGLACLVCKQIEVTPGNQLIECLECHNLYHQECHQPPATDLDINDPRRVWYCHRCHKNLKRMQAAKSSQKTKPPPVTTPKETPSLLSRTAKSEAAAPLPFKRTEIKVSPNQQSGNGSGNKPVGLAGLAANLSGSVTRSGAATQAKAKLPGGKNFSPFPSLMAAAAATTSTSKASFGLASLASAAAAVSKQSAPTRAIAAASSNNSATAISASSAGNNGTKLSSSSMMSADKRLQIMKKKAAAKMQEKRRLNK